MSLALWLGAVVTGLAACPVERAVAPQSVELAAQCEAGAKQSCFLPDRREPDGAVVCTEGTRECRAGQWGPCGDTHAYLATLTDTQRLVDPRVGAPTCSICDIQCFKVVDTLSAADGTGGSNLTFASGGGLTLPAVDSGTAGDAGVASSTGVCLDLARCCLGLSGTLGAACTQSANTRVEGTCAEALATYCPSAEIDGPRTDCTPGAGPDSDCDGVPNVVDQTVGAPLSTPNRTVFHQLDVGESGLSSIDVTYKLRNADVYFLFDSTGTMASEKQSLSDLLTTTNVVHCAQLAQCCAGDATCNTISGRNVASDCYAAQPTYCGSHIECADVDYDGTPNNELVDEGVVGGIRCLVGSAWFGFGSFREIPVHAEPETDRCPAEGCRYGDRDEQLFRHWVDMTQDHERIRTALGQLTMNYNWDDPEGGILALNSVVTGRGHYFGIHRPAVPDRSAGQDCPAGRFGYPCFRSDAIPVVVLFTDAPQHNGPADATSCNGRGAGCPYGALTSPGVYDSSSNDSASDRTARYVPVTAEAARSAHAVGDLRGRYLTLVGNTSTMAADYTSASIGCASADAAPDALIRFEVSAGSAIDINFHLTKDDAYGSTFYGAWTPWGLPAGSDDPTPATDFGSVISVFRGSPDDLSGTARRLSCVSDAQPTPLAGSTWHTRAIDFKLNLNSGTYYIAVKGTTADAKGRFQLQLGQTGARLKTRYQPPSWFDTRSALSASGVRVLPVLATGSVSSGFVAAAESQARSLALASGAVRTDGTPIWYRMQNDSAETGKAIVNSMAELAQHMAMNVALEAVDGPDPGASRFEVSVTPQNSPGCMRPHPLGGSAACDDSASSYKCNVQYACRPGAAPSYRVTFTNPSAAPVPLNPSDPYGGYLFRLQLKGDGKYLLSEIPVYLIPTTRTFAPPPPPVTSEGVYEQPIAAASCFTGSSESTLLPSWGDLYFHADLPEDTSLDFQLCTADSEALLDACDWSSDKVSVTAHGVCTTDADCANVDGYGTGACVSGLCRFVSPNKIWSSLLCTTDAQCPNGPLGAGDYVLTSRCQTDSSLAGYGRCIGVSPPLDLGALLGVGDNGKAFSKIHITFRANPAQTVSPTLFDWDLTYNCRAGR